MVRDVYATYQIHVSLL